VLKNLIGDGVEALLLIDTTWRCDGSIESHHRPELRAQDREGTPDQIRNNVDVSKPISASP